MLPLDPASGDEPVRLDDCSRAVDSLIRQGRAAEAVPLLRAILVVLPRHLPTYFRLLQAIWLLRRWDEGRDWALRLLRADPCDELAWAVLGSVAEQEGDLGAARRYWTKALENAPYNRQIRIGVNRTAVGRSDPLQLNHRALATLLRFGGRWDRAQGLYAYLLQGQPHAWDLQIGLLESLWRGGREAEALSLARQMTRSESNLLLPWLVLEQIGDENDQALAQAPLAALDPEREYSSARYGVEAAPTGQRIPLDAALRAQFAAFL